VEPPPSKTTLPECDRRFRSAFAHAAVGMAIIDCNGVFVYANQMLCRLSGYAEHELCGMKFPELFGPEDQASRWDELRQILAGSTGSFINERGLLRKDGSVVWVRSSAAAPGNPAGPLQIITFVEEINERKQAEEALQVSEQRFRIAAENSSDMIYEWDLESGQVDAFGAAPKRMGDWPLPHSYEAWKSLVHSDDLERILTASARHIEKGERYSDQYRVIGRSGKVFHYSIRGQSILNSSGEPSKCIGLLSDITESKLAEEAVSQLAAIVRCSESAIIATDVAGAITSWNDAAQQLLGYTDAQSHGLPVTALLASGDLAHELLSQIQKGQSSRLGEALFARQDGSQVPVLLSISPIRKSDGQLSGSAIIAHDISARKEAEREMEYCARHDHLTGLPNRLSLGDQLADSIANADLDTSGTAVIFVDLDGFKFVNDTLGHEAGDILLQQVAQRLSASVRRGDMLARMGGDEFVVVVNGVTDDQLAQSVADRLSAALLAPFFVDHHELVITASMGISIYPRDGTDVSSLRRNADTAMYEAKQSGKDRIRFYRPALGAAVQTRLEMENDLRRALDRDELCHHYQPIFDAANNRQTAYEALSRWRHKDLGYVPPSQFIPLAEETGLIIRLGEWVLREACRQCRWWQDHGKPQIRAAVNVSSLQFGRADFVDIVLGVLNETGLTGDLLDLELTESIVMRDIDSAIRKMAHLRQQGIRISVDDFGTGYSALGYLPKLPIDIVKIDRSFVAQIGENEVAVPLIRGMISLAHSIDKRVIVEGVETAAQLKILRNLNCDEVQGFLLGRPGRLTRRDERPQEITTGQLISA
jgi:diguanylate cyclase (GGDEF)-like protein/PAS domain S-box-containing protein